MDLVLFSPSTQSNVGEKISKKLEKHIDELVDEIVSMLDIKHTYFYSRYTSKSSKNDLSQKIINDNDTFICMYCGNSFLELLYTSIRNALAHGNILKKGKFYYLFALSAQEKQLPVTERNLSFLLKVRSFKNLSVYMDAFKRYN